MMTPDHALRLAAWVARWRRPVGLLFVPMLLLIYQPAGARTCSQDHQACVSKCMRLGIGASRTIGVSRPMSRDACEAHCIGWTQECKKTGCFHGDLHQECGLVRQ